MDIPLLLYPYSKSCLLKRSVDGYHSIVLITRYCGKLNLIAAVIRAAISFAFYGTEAIDVGVPVEVVIVADGYEYCSNGYITVHDDVTLRVVVVRLVLPVVKLPASVCLGNQVGCTAGAVHSGALDAAAVGRADCYGEAIVLVIDEFRSDAVITVHYQDTGVTGIAVCPPTECVVLGGGGSYRNYGGLSAI